MNSKFKSARVAREKHDFRYSVNFTPSENAKMLTMYELSGVRSKSTFIKARVFNDTFRVIKVDNSQVSYYQKLTNFYGQFRSIGVNYNQVVATLQSHFSEKQAMAMLYKLEKLTIELAVVGGEIVQLTNAFREKNERCLGQK